MKSIRPSPDEAAHHLVGRDPELALLGRFVRDAAGAGGALLLTGEAGIGKSVLLDAAAATAASLGTVVLRAGGLEAPAEVGFSTLRPLLQPLLQAVGGRLGELHPVHRDALTLRWDPEPQDASARMVVYNATLELLRRSAADRPLLLVVDDLHWVDEATAALLGFVARRLSGTRAGLLASARPGVQSVFARAGLPQHALTPLDDAAAAELIGTRFPALGARTAQRLLCEAQGNPLALLELPLALSPAQREAVQPLPATLPLSRRLRTVFGARVQELPPATRRLLLLAALETGGDLAIPLRAAAAGLAELAPAERAQLVTVDHGGRRLIFRHPLVRSTVVGLSTVKDRLAAHRALAAVLTAEPERHLWHLAAATAHPDEDVAGRLEHVAHLVLRRGDAVGAFTTLLRSADLTADGSARSRRLADAAYLGADVTGELRTAAMLLIEAGRADPALRDSPRSAVAAAYLLLNTDGDVSAAHRVLVDAIVTASAGPDGAEQPLAEALHTLLEVCLYGARPELWPAFHEAMRRVPAVPPMLRLLVGVLAGFGEPAGPDVAAVEAAIDGLADEADPTRIERIGTAALFLDRAFGCREALWRVVDDGRDGGAVTSAINALMVLCIDDFMTGQWQESARLADEGLRLCEVHGYGLLGWPFRFGQALLAAARGDQPTVRRLVAEMDGWAGPRDVRAVRHYAAHASALGALARGDAEAAFRQASRISPPGCLPFGVPTALWVGMDLVEAAVRTGRHAAAAAHVAALRQAGVAQLSPRLAMLTNASAALVAADGDAAELFDRALTVADAQRWPFDFARVHLAYGEHLRRVHAAASARDHIATALGLFQRLGSEPWAARAAAVLRAAGESVPGAHPEVTAQPALTADELLIAQLGASGLTNKQIGERLFLSHRTVGSRLHRIFPKLGITSRAALRDALSGLPADGQPTAHR